MELVNRAYLRAASAAVPGAVLVEMDTGALVSAASVADEDLGPFTYALPGTRLGAVVADGLTERWSLPYETATGEWALRLPDGMSAGSIAGLPAGYVESATAPVAVAPAIGVT
jgi:hypothetical protein